jgi:hypothetical protein
MNPEELEMVVYHISSISHSTIVCIDDNCVCGWGWISSNFAASFFCRSFRSYIFCHVQLLPAFSSDQLYFFV